MVEDSSAAPNTDDLTPPKYFRELAADFRFGHVLLSEGLLEYIKTGKRAPGEWQATHDLAVLLWQAEQRGFRNGFLIASLVQNPQKFLP